MTTIRKTQTRNSELTQSKKMSYSLRCHFLGQNLLMVPSSCDTKLLYSSVFQKRVVLWGWNIYGNFWWLIHTCMVVECVVFLRCPSQKFGGFTSYWIKSLVVFIGPYKVFRLSKPGFFFSEWSVDNKQFSSQLLKKSNQKPRRNFMSFIES